MSGGTGPARDVSGIERFLTTAVRFANKGEHATAERLCHQILEVFPEAPKALHLMAMLRRSQDDAAGERAFLARAHAADPANPAIALDLCEALSKAGEQDEARDILDRLPDPGAEAPEDRLRLAYLLVDVDRTARAETMLRDIVGPRPVDTGPALELVKLLARTDRNDEAEALLLDWSAASQEPIPEIELALAALDEARKRYAEARSRLEKVWAHAPTHLETGRKLAHLHTLHGEYDAAAKVLAECHETAPDDRPTMRAYCKALRRLDDARRLLTVMGDYATRHQTEYWARIAVADSMVTLGDRVKFITVLENVLAEDPKLEDRLSCAFVLARGRQPARAAEIVDGIPHDDDMPNGLVSILGQTLVEIGRIDEGLACFRRILEKDRHNVGAYGHLSTWLAAKKEYAAAIRIMTDCLDLDPINANVAQNLAMLHLQAGNFQQGFRYYTAVYRKDPYRKKYESYRPKIWDGTPIPGRRILVWADQGIGDQIIYSTFLGTLAARQAFDLETDERLVPLYARSLPEVQVRSRPEIEADYGLTDAYAAHLPLCLLPGHVLFSRADIPPARPYLKADPDRVRELRASLRALTGDRPLVGLSWRSVNTHIGRYKTTRLKDWGAVLRTPDVAFVALQYGNVAAEIQEAAEIWGVDVHEAAGIDRFKDLDGLAALISAMDAVVTTSNSNAHMAGALGVPTATVLSADPGLLWYWFGEGETTPWYPRMDLIRQTVPGEWTHAFERAGRWLANRLGRPSE